MCIDAVNKINTCTHMRVHIRARTDAVGVSYRRLKVSEKHRFTAFVYVCVCVCVLFACAFCVPSVLSYLNPQAKSTSKIKRVFSLLTN